MPDEKDPWGRQKKRNEPVPPNLDEVFNKLLGKLSQLEKANRLKSKFDKNPPEGLGGESGSQSPTGGSLGLFLVIIILFLIWALSGIFIVSPPEQGVILRFGRYQETVGPGPHWIPRFIDGVNIVNVQQISTFSYEADMLTKDENIVFVSLSVQFRIHDPRQFLFNVVNPIISLQQATASTLRQVIGNTSLDEVLTTGQMQVRDEVKKRLMATLDPYQTGLLITDANIQTARPPTEVTGAFDDAIKAREDEQSYINGARANAEKAVLLAEGRAGRIMREAHALKEKLPLQAKADTASYLALLPEYRRTPDITRQRLYLETLESVLTHSHKVLLDTAAGGNHALFYLPLDKLLDKTLKTAESAGVTAASSDHNTEAPMMTKPELDQAALAHKEEAQLLPSSRVKRRLKYSDALSE